MAEVLCFDQQKLIQHISEGSLSFRLFTRLALDRVFSVFLEEEALLGHDLFQSENEASFFQTSLPAARCTERLRFTPVSEIVHPNVL